MANSNRDLPEHQHDDCIDDTSSDTSSDEEGGVIRPVVSRKRKLGLELPYGHESSNRTTKRPLCVGLAIVLAIFATAAAIGGGVYYGVVQKNAPLQSVPPATEEEAFFAVRGDEQDTTKQIEPQTAEEVSSSSSTNTITGTDSLGLLQETVDFTASSDTDKTNTEQERPTSWPGLVGMTGTDAKAQLESEYGETTYQIVILHQNDPTTRDYRFNRIRIRTDDDGIVVSPPLIG